MKPVEWDDIAGGRAKLEAAHESIEEEAEAKQKRFADVLDSLGIPGAAAWDPVAGFVELRGHRFVAQQVGSYDGETWLWSWANEYLNLPAEKTALARKLRDLAPRISAALATAMIVDDDELLPHMFASLAIAHDLGDAYYIANQEQVYLIEKGELDKVPKLDRAAVRRYATWFSMKRRTLNELLTHLRMDRYLNPLAHEQSGDDVVTFSGAGWSLTLRRRDRLRDVLAEIKTLPAQAQEAARGAATVFVLEGNVDFSKYEEGAYDLSMAGWIPSERPGGPNCVPWQVLRLCERANGLDKIHIHDTRLGRFYPRSG